MSATGNEAVKLSQLKEIYKVASNTHYGVVKLVNDDVLMSLIGGAGGNQFEVSSDGADFTMSDYNITGSVSDSGQVTISGNLTFRNNTTLSTSWYTIGTIPQEYRPESQQTGGTCSLSNPYGPTYRAYVRVQTNGELQVHTTSSRPNINGIKDINIVYSIPYTPPADLSDGTYAITVQQLKMLVNGGGGSGGDSGTEETLWTGYSNSAITIQNKDLADYSRIIVNGDTIDYAEVSSSAPYNTQIQSNGGWFYVYASESKYIGVMPQGIYISKVIGVKR